MKTRTMTDFEKMAIEDYYGEGESGFKKIARSLKSTFAKELKPYGITIAKYLIGYFYVSMFVKKDDKYIYISTTDIRFIPWEEPQVLYRTAQSTEDFHGGHNNFCKFSNLTNCVVQLFKEQS